MCSHSEQFALRKYHPMGEVRPSLSSVDTVQYANSKIVRDFNLRSSCNIQSCHTALIEARSSFLTKIWIIVHDFCVLYSSKNSWRLWIGEEHNQCLEKRYPSSISSGPDRWWFYEKLFLLPLKQIQSSGNGFICWHSGTISSAHFAALLLTLIFRLYCSLVTFFSITHYAQCAVHLSNGSAQSVCTSYKQTKIATVNYCLIFRLALHCVISAVLCKMHSSSCQEHASKRESVCLLPLFWRWRTSVALTAASAFYSHSLCSISHRPEAK